MIVRENDIPNRTRGRTPPSRSPSEQILKCLMLRVALEPERIK